MFGFWENKIEHEKIQFIECELYVRFDQILRKTCQCLGANCQVDSMERKMGFKNSSHGCGRIKTNH